MHANYPVKNHPCVKDLNSDLKLSLELRSPRRTQKGCVPSATWHEAERLLRGLPGKEMKQLSNPINERVCS